MKVFFITLLTVFSTASFGFECEEIRKPEFDYDQNSRSGGSLTPGLYKLKATKPGVDKEPINYTSEESCYKAAVNCLAVNVMTGKSTIRHKNTEYTTYTKTSYERKYQLTTFDGDVIDTFESSLRCWWERSWLDTEDIKEIQEQYSVQN